MLLGDPLSRVELVGKIPGKIVWDGMADAASDVGTQWHPAHGLDTASDADVDGTDPDEVVHEVIGLLGRAALAVHRRRGDLVREACVEPGHSGDVEALLARLGHTPADDLFDD